TGLFHPGQDCLPDPGGNLLLCPGDRCTGLCLPGQDTVRAGGRTHALRGIGNDHPNAAVKQRLCLRQGGSPNLKGDNLRHPLFKDSVDQFRERGERERDRFPACYLPFNFFWGKIRDGRSADIEVGTPFFETRVYGPAHISCSLHWHVLHAGQETVVYDGDIGTKPVCFERELLPHLPAGPGGQHPHVIHRFAAGTTRDQYLFPGKRTAEDGPLAAEDDLINPGDLCLPLFDLRAREADAPRYEGFDVPHHGRVPVHAMVHRRYYEHRHSTAKRSRGKSRNRSIINTARDFPEGVCRAGRNKKKRGASAIATVRHMLNKAREPGDRLPAARVRESIGMNNTLRRRAHDRLDPGSFPAQRMDEFYGFDSSDAPGHADHDLFSCEGLYGHARVTSCTTCHVCGRYFFTLCTWMEAEKPAPSTMSRITFVASPMLCTWITLPSPT